MPHIVLSDCKYKHGTQVLIKHISKGINNMDHMEAFQRHFISFTKKFSVTHRVI